MHGREVCSASVAAQSTPRLARFAPHSNHTTRGNAALGWDGCCGAAAQDKGRRLRELIRANMSGSSPAAQYFRTVWTNALLDWAQATAVTAMAHCRSQRGHGRSLLVTHRKDDPLRAGFVWVAGRVHIGALVYQPKPAHTKI